MKLLQSRFFWGGVFGMLTGIVCLLGNLPAIPVGSVNEIYLFVAFWQRMIMGLMIGALSRLKQLVHTILRGLVIGALFSIHLAFFTGIFGVNFLIAGIIFGCAIEILLYIMIKIKIEG